MYAQARTESGPPISPAEPEAVRQQVERIVADPLFRNSKRYSGLLKFIAERSLDGRNDELKERIIGIEVFQRSPDYDTSNDATVRVAANEVRKRLTLYYNEPAHEQELRIDVPSGSYVAEFRLPEQSRAVAKPVPALRGKLWYFLGSAVAVLILALAAWGLVRALSPKPVIDRFWAPMLSGSHPVVLYLSSPFNNVSSSTPPPAPSDSSDSGKQFHEFLRQRGQVPIADVNAASALSAFLERKGRESVIRSARGAKLSDLRSAPAVLLGSFNNDWVMKLGEDLHFRFRRESELGLRWIEDSANPKSRNWAMDLSAPYGQVNEDYVLISRMLDQTEGQWVIVIGGLTGFGTSTACEIVTDPNAMASLSAQFPKNWASQNLQVVLAVKLVQGSPGASRVVAAYSW